MTGLNGTSGTSGSSGANGTSGTSIFTGIVPAPGTHQGNQFNNYYGIDIDTVLGNPDVWIQIKVGDAFYKVPGYL